jgi:uncharacterized membrane protein YbaN (DUF454 family)
MWIWRIIGGVAFVLGVFGLALPIWPTTVFWIIAAFAFARSNPAWRDWIYARPIIGPTVKNFNERGILSRTGKIAAVTGMAASGVIMALTLRAWPPALIAGLAALVMGSFYVISRPER